MGSETFLTFMMGKDYFGVNVNQVYEVLEKQVITFVPDAPDRLLGIINFRGDILPVLNTHRLFELTDPKCNDLERLLIVLNIDCNDSQYSVAISADKVNDVINIDLANIKSMPTVGIKYNPSYFSGFSKSNGNFIHILVSSNVFTLCDSEKPEIL
jgi:purine-binding chemotaxis protein CheW